MSKLLATDHPHFYAIRALRLERDSVEEQMIATWRANRDELTLHDSSPWLLLVTGRRLRTLGRQRRQLRSAMRLLVDAK